MMMLYFDNVSDLQECNLTVLEACLSYGVHMSCTQPVDSVPSDHMADSEDSSLDHLLQATHITLLWHINNIINSLPLPHQLVDWSDLPSDTEESYHEKLEDLYCDAGLVEQVCHLGVALLLYLRTLPWLPGQQRVPDESANDVVRFVVLLMEVIFAC